MRAIRFYSKYDIRVEQVDQPQCGKDEVKIAPAFAGICGSDLHEYQYGPLQKPLTGDAPPVILGHEFSGTVEEIGADVSHVKVGDRVVVKPNLPDGTCMACKADVPNCCSQFLFIGYNGIDGGMCEHTVVPAYTVIPIPDSVSFEAGALVEPLCVAWHAITRGSLKKGDTALVTGGGPIGIAVLQLLKLRGASKVFVAEIAPQRKENARQFGATEILDPTEVDVVAKVRELTDGKGVDIAFDSAGVQSGLNASISAVRARGTVVNIAPYVDLPKINTNEMMMQEKTFVSTIIYETGDFEAVIEEIASGRLRPEPMITRKIKMEDVTEKGFEALIHDKGNQVKILIDISA